MESSIIRNTLIGMSPENMVDLLLEFDEPKFRAKQIFHWIYNRQIQVFDDMVNIPKPLREKLKENLAIHPLKKVIISGEPGSNSQKYLFKTQTGEQIESVLIREQGRVTICVSTQVGCALDCAFCATAKMGFSKNLTAGEIVDQVLYIQHDIGERVTNVVFMGMGEPFLNYERVMKAASLLNEPSGINIGARKITISTAGIIPKIKQFTEEQHRYKLAISLNAGSQEQRLRIMPIAKTHPLGALIDAARYYYESTRNHLTFEYVLLDRINDTPGDAKRLMRLIGGLPCKVNVIPYNDIGGEYQRSSEQRIQNFLHELKDAPFTVTVRRSKGTKIDAGCGQLATKVL